MTHREVEYAHNTSYISHNDVLPPPVVSLPLSRQRNWSIRSVTQFRNIRLRNMSFCSDYSLCQAIRFSLTDHFALAISKEGNGMGESPGNGMGEWNGSGNRKVMQDIKEPNIASDSTALEVSFHQVASQ